MVNIKDFFEKRNLFIYLLVSDHFSQSFSSFFSCTDFRYYFSDYRLKFSLNVLFLVGFCLRLCFFSIHNFNWQFTPKSLQFYFRDHTLTHLISSGPNIDHKYWIQILKPLEFQTYLIFVDLQKEHFIFPPASKPSLKQNWHSRRLLIGR